MFDFLLDPIGEIERAQKRVDLFRESLRRVPEKKVAPCDFMDCALSVEKTLGSGLLCSHHYYVLFPKEIK